MEILTIKNNLEEYLKNNKCYMQHDFATTEHKDMCISIKKFCKFSLIDHSSLENIKIINSREYITLQYALQVISKIKNHKVIEFQKTFGLVNIVETSNFKFAESLNIKLPLQLLFTYSVDTFLQKNFNNLNLEVEDDFLKRFKNIHIEYTKGPRTDIIINEINLVLEYDEKQHLKYENIVKDTERDQIIRTLGYEVIRFAEGHNPFIFFDKLKKIIKERQFLFDTSKLSDYVIDLFHSQGYDIELITLLTKEQCDDIINGEELDNIGMTPKNLTLSTLLKFIKCDDKEYIAEIKEYIDDLVYPYEEYGDEILLSPKAFEELLSKLDSSKHTLIIKIRELYINIKNYFLKYLYDTNNKLLKIYKNTTETLDVLINYTYDRGLKDSFTKCKLLEDKNSKLETELETLKKIYINSLPHNEKGIIKKEMVEEKKLLEIGKSIIPEIPEIIYTNDNNDYICEEEIETLYKNNQNIFKISKMRSLTKCIKIIKKKINLQTNNDLLYGLVIGCKINYEINKVVKDIKKSKIIIDEPDEEIKIKKIIKSKIILEQSDDEIM